MGNVFFTVHPLLKEVSSIFAEKNKGLYLVGGAVRDNLRGTKAQDWDLATDALPTEVIAMFQETKHRGFVIPTGIKHGTVTVHFKGRVMEVTTFRTESGYSDGRRPDMVEFGTSIEADLSRRDFTMNAIAYKLPAGPLVDPFGGQNDIRAKIIRSVGRAEERFAEDGLRPLRAVRFASQLDFSLDKNVLDAIPGCLALCGQVAPERIREELDKMYASSKPSLGFFLMEQTGLLRILLPELADCRGVEQKGFHRFDVFEHCLLALDYAAKSGFSREVRLAALFHDIGKPLVRSLNSSGVWTFYQHERESSCLTRKILLRFRYPNALMDRVCHLIEEHMFHYTDTWSDAAIRRFIVRAGEEYLPELYQLRRADSFAQAGVEPDPESLRGLTDRVSTALNQRKALSLKDLAISGKDLLEEGIAPGKRMGIILAELLETVLDDPELNTRAKLLEIALNMEKNTRGE